MTDIEKEFQEWRDAVAANFGEPSAEMGYLAAAAPRDLLIAQLVGALREARLGHHINDVDNWYSCPKSEEGCSDEGAGTECNCGADSHNAWIETALAAAKERGYE